jgi:hypothetical protein
MAVRTSAWTQNGDAVDGRGSRTATSCPGAYKENGARAEKKSHNPFHSHERRAVAAVVRAKAAQRSARRIGAILEIFHTLPRPSRKRRFNSQGGAAFVVERTKDHNMPKVRLVTCSAKFDRARESIRNLAAELQLFLTDGYHPGWYERAHGYSETVEGPPVPPRFAVLVGEVAHHLRSSLDHLVWQLVCHESGEERTTSTEFPIFKNRPVAAKQVARFEQKIRGVNPRVADRIKAIQPYQQAEPEEDPLWLVYELDRIDKQRLLIATVAKVQLHDNREHDGQPGLDYGAPIGTRASEVPLDDEVSIHVVITDAPNRHAKSAVPLLAFLTNYTEAVIESFEPHFH